MRMHRLREYLQHIQGSSDKTLPLPPQPALRIYLGFNLFLKTGHQKHWPQFRAQARRGHPCIQFLPWPSILFIYSRFPAHTRQTRPRLLSFLVVVKIMARVWRGRNLGPETKKPHEGGKSGQLLNSFIVPLCKGLIQETRSRAGCNRLASNCGAHAKPRRVDQRDGIERRPGPDSAWQVKVWQL
jgi:hypothetical protein